MQFNPRVLLGIILLAGGILAAVYGGFTYTSESHSADLGPVEISLEEQERVNIPLWAGVAAAVLGAVVLAVRKP
jgi:drug/metabolite transporter (DMT)-like permease